jgi:hypothetical protein
MSRIKGTKSSAALIVAVVALVAALGGGAVAGVAVTSLNKKDKKQVRKISKKEANKRIDKREPKLSVASAGTAGDADLLDGRDASEFAEAPSVRTSGYVGLNAPTTPGSNEVTLIDTGLLRLVGRCVREGDDSITSQIDMETTTQQGLVTFEAFLGDVKLGALLGTNDSRTLAEVSNVGIDRATYSAATANGEMLDGAAMVTRGLLDLGNCQFSASGLSSSG